MTRVDDGGRIQLHYYADILLIIFLESKFSLPTENLFIIEVNRVNNGSHLKYKKGFIPGSFTTSHKLLFSFEVIKL